MKIQPTGSGSNIGKKKNVKSKSSESFEALFASKTGHTEQVVATTPRPEQETHQQKPDLSNFAETLGQLEGVIAKLEGDPENQHQAQEMVSELRQALRQSPALAGMSDKDLQDNDALLAVESKRLEKLQRSDLG